MEAVIHQREDVCPVQETHEAQGSVLKCPEQPSRHIDGLGFDFSNMVLETAIFLKRHPQVLDLLDLFDPFPV